MKLCFLLGDFVGEVRPWTTCCPLGPWPLGGVCNVGLTAVDEFVSDLEHLQKSSGMTHSRTVPHPCTENVAFSHSCGFSFLRGIPSSLRPLGQADWRASLWPTGGTPERQVDGSSGFRPCHSAGKVGRAPVASGRGGNWRKLVQAGRRKLLAALCDWGRWG